MLIILCPFRVERTLLMAPCSHLLIAHSLMNSIPLFMVYLFYLDKLYLDILYLLLTCRAIAQEDKLGSTKVITN
jgi:hypothetical protein